MPTADILIAQMNAYYLRRADCHDQCMSYTGNEAMEALLREVVHIVATLVRNRTVLEIACGTGNWTQVLVKRAKSVLATDLSEHALEIACTKQYLGKVNFRKCNAYDLEGVGGGFDVAFMADWWSHLPNSRIAPFLDRLHPLLKPGGTVICTDMLPFEQLCRWPSYTDAEGNLVQKRRWPEPDGDEFLVVKNFPDEEELTTRLSGLADGLQYKRFPEIDRWIAWYITPALPAS